LVKNIKKSIFIIAEFVLAIGKISAKESCLCGIIIATPFEVEGIVFRELNYTIPLRGTVLFLQKKYRNHAGFGVW